MDSIELCTCLWGGVLNPILPLDHCPAHTSRIPHCDHVTAAEVVSGFIQTFEPDAIVTTDPTALPKCDLIKRQPIVTLGELLARSRDGDPHYGVSMTEVYGHMFKQDFRFVSKRERQVFRPDAVPPGFELFAAARWGRLPSVEASPSFNRDFDFAFSPTSRSWSVESVTQIERDVSASPLSLTFEGLEGWFGSPCVLVLDQDKPSDIMGYWSLRAYGVLVLAVPQDLINEYLPLVARFIEQYHRPPDEHGMHSRHVWIRGVAGDSCRAAKSLFQSLTPTARSHCWYESSIPPLWSARLLQHSSVRPIHPHAAEVDADALLRDDRYLTLRLLSPSFVNHSAASFSAAYVNRVAFSSHHRLGDGFVVPKQSGELGSLLHSFGSDVAPRQVSDGIAVTCRGRRNHLFLELPQGHEIIVWWLKKQGWTASSSGAGLIAQRLVSTLGGPLGVGIIASENIIKLLDGFTRNNVRQVLSRSSLIARIGDALDSEHLPHQLDAERRFDLLVERGALRVGLQLQCTVCRQHNWHDVDALKTQLVCDRCLATFQFPAASPPIDAWRYRPVGPFAIEDYAHGAYCVALVLKHFVVSLHGDSSWSTGLELRSPTLSPSRSLEVDLMLSWTSRFRGQGDIIVVECKSFEKQFAATDVERMRELLRAFPTAVGVFATMKRSLGTRERERLSDFVKSLAEREDDTGIMFRPIMILTGIELFSDYAPPTCWTDAGGRFATFAADEGYSIDLARMCLASQRLHLTPS